MSLRVLQVCCVRAPPDLTLAELLERWPTLGDVAEATARAGAEVVVLIDGPRDLALRHNGVLYRQVKGLSKPTWRNPFELRAATQARACAPDVIHMAGLEAPFTTRALCGTGIPVIAQDHASRARRAPWWRWGFAKLEAAAFTARDQALPFVDSGHLSPRTRIFAIPESSSHFTPGRRADARLRSQIYGDPAVLWVGHLDSNKNPMMVLRAVQRVMAELPRIALWCAFGSSPLRPAIDALLAEDPDLRARVHLLGHIRHDEIQRLFRACDLFVSASRREGSGYALIEALACGCRVVVTDIPPFRALLGGGAAGSLVPDDNDEAMAAAILRECAETGVEEEARRSMVRRHFDENLSFDVIGAELVAAYTAMVGG